MGFANLIHPPTSTTQVQPQAPQYLSTDPTAGQPASTTQTAATAPGPGSQQAPQSIIPGYSTPPPAYNGDPGAFIAQLQKQLTDAGIQPNQADPAVINYIVSALQKVDPGGNWTTAGTDANGHTDGVKRNGVGYKLIDGSNRWLPGMQTYGQAEGGGGGGTLGGFGSLNFAAPSAADAANYPGTQFGLKLGTDAIQHSAAAHGTLLTGGTLKALEGYGIGLGSQNYQNVFNNALATNQTNYGNLLGLANLGRGAVI